MTKKEKKYRSVCNLLLRRTLFSQHICSTVPARPPTCRIHVHAREPVHSHSHTHSRRLRLRT